MIKKYFVDSQSSFNKSLMLPFYEGCRYGFRIEGLDDHSKRVLFDSKNIKFTNKTGEVDPKSLPTYAHIVYLDEDYSIKALIFFSSITKQYYEFRVDHQDEYKLKIQSNYINANSVVLENDYEKSLKKKGVNHYQGVGDFNTIKDLNYYDHKCSSIISSRVNKTSNISRLIFNKNNKFTADFVHFAHRGIIAITNKEMLDEKVLSSDIHASLKNDRKDCLFINFNTGDIEYFIYTYRPLYVNHYLLFKKLGDNKYEFMKEDIFFNKLLLDTNQDFKIASEFASKNLSNMNYNDFFKVYQEFEEGEQVDEELNDELNLLEQVSNNEIENKFVVLEQLDLLLDKYHYSLKGNSIYFDDYEIMPLAFIEKDSIKIDGDRMFNNSPLVEVLLSNQEEIENRIKELLFNKPSSRLTALKCLVDELTSSVYLRGDDHQSLLINEIDNNIKTLWPSDIEYPLGYYQLIDKKYNDWLKEAKTQERKPLIDVEINVTLHASLRMIERIGKMSDLEMKNLAQKAYTYGLTSVHFLEKDVTMFKFLQYQQNKYPNKTLRLYKDFVYIFSLTPPYNLVTCFHISENYERYKKNMRK